MTGLLKANILSKQLSRLEPLGFLEIELSWLLNCDYNYIIRV